jgi:hypothetical protein
MSLISEGTTTVDIYRASITNTYGEVIQTWSTQVSGWVCTKQQRTGAETIDNNVKGYRTVWMYYGDIQDITNKDILIHSGTTYRILNVYKPRNHHLQVETDLLQDVK